MNLVRGGGGIPERSEDMLTQASALALDAYWQKFIKKDTRYHPWGAMKLPPLDIRWRIAPHEWGGGDEIGGFNMIYIYTGTPGSGKSLHCIKDIIFKLKHGGNVISNFPVNTSKIKGCKGEFIFKLNKDLTPEYLVEYARKNHIKGKEAQTLIVIDEAQSLFNPRDFRDLKRKDYNQFFSLHRHLGYNVILITQNDRLLDKQIRCLIEYEVKHRKINNFKTIGMLIPFKSFACISYWYGVREKLGVEFFVYRKYLSDMYDSYALFDVVGQEEKKSDSSQAGLGVGGSPVLTGTVRKKFSLDTYTNKCNISSKLYKLGGYLWNLLMKYWLRWRKKS